MRRKLVSVIAAGAALLFAAPLPAVAQSAREKWRGDLSPVSAKDWNAELLNGRFKPFDMFA